MQPSLLLRIWEMLVALYLVEGWRVEYLVESQLVVFANRLDPLTYASLSIDIILFLELGNGPYEGLSRNLKGIGLHYQSQYE